MKCAFVTIPFRGLMSVNRSNPKSVTYVSGTFVTLDSGLYTLCQRGEITAGMREKMDAR